MEEGADEKPDCAIWLQTLCWRHLGFLKPSMILAWLSADGGGEHERELLPPSKCRLMPNLFSICKFLLPSHKDELGGSWTHTEIATTLFFPRKKMLIKTLKRINYLGFLHGMVRVGKNTKNHPIPPLP